MSSIKNLKIAIINDMPPVAGITTYIYNIFLNLKIHNMKVDFYQFDSSNFYKDRSDIIVKKGINFHISESNGLNAVLGLNYRFFKKLNKEYDIILISGPTLNKLSKFYENLIFFGHDLYYLYNNNPLIYSNYMKKQYELFKDAKEIIVNSQYTKNEFIKNLNINDSKIDVIYPAINNQIFYPGKSKIRDELNVNDNDFLLLNVAPDFKPNKNVITVLKVLKNLPNNIKLIRVGKSTNTIKLISEWNLKDRVFFFENVNTNKLGDIYRSSDLFIFPSIFEGFGSPVIEAMGCGLPIIVSNRTSLPEVIGPEGLIYDPYDVEGMKNIILYLSNNKINYEFFKEKSIERSRLFTLENQFEKISVIFKKLI